MDGRLQALISELEAALTTASPAKQTAILRDVTALFMAQAEAFSAAQVAVFDEVMGTLIKSAPDWALTELSRTLAPVTNAPAKASTTLAAHRNIAVAGPLLERSVSVSDDSLVEIAANAHRDRLQLLAARAEISESLSDVLVDRGDGEIARKVLGNPGAHVSELGFVKLINRAKTDRALADTIAARTDLPPELEPFLKLALAS
jgi:uncharacterized protein (DUF2336 family)